MLTCAGDVRGFTAVCCTARWLLGNRGHDRNCVHMLLHGQDTGGVPVRARPEHGAAGPSSRLVRVDRSGLFRAGVGRPGRERGPDDRVADDVHTVRGGVRRPDGRHVPRRRD